MDLKEKLKTFVTVAHLVMAGRLDIWQEAVPVGDIFVAQAPSRTISAGASKR